MSTATGLTTTSYAILGLLAVRPFTTYEIAKQMDRALGQFWPRGRSKLYEEPKKLVAHGLARASQETVGSRPRTVYSITAKGRRALRDWVPEPGNGPVLEFELLIKVFFAEHGSRADLLRTLDAARTWSDEQTLATGSIAREYLDGRGPYPERLPWLTLVGQFLDDFLVLVAEWAEWATAVVEEWPDDPAEAQPDLAALEGQARRADEVALRSEQAEG
jgi:PadR family transcriptional regulator, regulatory protein AphA